MTDQIPHMRADLIQETEEERLAFAKSILPHDWEVDATSGSVRKFSGGAEVWSVDTVSATWLRSLNCRLTRRGESAGGGLFRLRLIVGGSVEGIVGGEFHRMEEGDLSLEAPGVQMAVECEEMSAQVIALPSHEVEFDPNAHPHFAIISGSTAPGKMLGTILRGYFDLLPDAGLKEAENAAAMWPGLIAGWLSRLGAVGQPERDLHARKLVEMKAYIEEHLDDPDLDVGTLVEKFPVSRAVAYRLFQPDGGMQKYITDRRMLNAARLLAFSTKDSVSDVARKVGYANASHFSRAFRNRFGMTPSEVQAAYRPSQVAHASASDEAIVARLRELFRD